MLPVMRNGILLPTVGKNLWTNPTTLISKANITKLEGKKAKMVKTFKGKSESTSKDGQHGRKQKQDGREAGQKSGKKELNQRDK